MTIHAALFLYFVCGLIEWKWGSASRDLKKEIEEISAEKDFARLSPSQFDKRLALVKIGAFVFSVLFYPLFYSIKLYDLIFNHKQRTISLDVATVDPFAYFDHLGGAGTVWCSDCGHSEEIISFIHGATDSLTGMQCQSCGQFSELNDVEMLNQPRMCACGGTLERNAALFCPTCKSKNINYDMRYIS